MKRRCSAKGTERYNYLYWDACTLGTKKNVEGSKVENQSPGRTKEGRWVLFYNTGSAPATKRGTYKLAGGGWGGIVGQVLCRHRTKNAPWPRVTGSL